MDELIALCFMICVNIVIIYLYRDNIIFPILFSLFEIIYALEIVALNEIFVIFLLSFSVLFNLFTIIENRSKN